MSIFPPFSALCSLMRVVKESLPIKSGSMFEGFNDDQRELYALLRRYVVCLSQ